MAQVSCPLSIEVVPAAGWEGLGSLFVALTAVLEPWILTVIQFAVLLPPFLFPAWVSPEKFSNGLIGQSV